MSNWTQTEANGQGVKGGLGSIVESDARLGLPFDRPSPRAAVRYHGEGALLNFNEDGSVNPRAVEAARAARASASRPLRSVILVPLLSPKGR